MEKGIRREKNNTVKACKECNQEKGRKPIEQWLQEIRDNNATDPRIPNINLVVRNIKGCTRELLLQMKICPVKIFESLCLF